MFFSSYKNKAKQNYHEYILKCLPFFHAHALITLYAIKLIHY